MLPPRSRQGRESIHPENLTCKNLVKKLNFNFLNSLKQFKKSPYFGREVFLKMFDNLKRFQ